MERKLLFTVKCQIINVEGMIEIENHHLATLILVSESGRRHEWILELVGRN